MVPKEEAVFLLHVNYEWFLVEMCLNNSFYVTAVPLAITSYDRFTLGKLIYSLKGVRLGSRHKPNLILCIIFRAAMIIKTSKTYLDSKLKWAWQA